MDVQCHCGAHAALEIVKKGRTGVCGAPQEAQSIGTVQGVVVLFVELDHCSQRDCPLQGGVASLSVLCYSFALDVNKGFTVSAVSPCRLVAAAVLAFPLFVEYEPVEKKYFKLYLP